MSIGGIQPVVSSEGEVTDYAYWDEGCSRSECGSNLGPEQDLAAPAKSVISSVYKNFNQSNLAMCGDSFLAGSDADSFAYRRNFIRTYLERDVAQFGPRIPAETLDRLWTMLAHSQGTLLNASKLATGLSVSAPTVTSYIDLLVDLLLVRRLRPLHANTGKRLVKSPKVYVRDSGLVHALLGLGDYNDLAGHPVVGTSWEGFVIENLLAVASDRTIASFYRTAAGAEIDLVLKLPGKRGLWAIDIKRGVAARPEQGFHNAREDVNPTRSFVVHPGEERYPISEGVEAIGLKQLASILA